MTLLELMITVVISALLLAIGVPSYQGLAERSRLVGAKNTLINDFATARSEAVSRSARVVICSGTSDCSGSNQWEDGWLVFVDRNGDSDLDNASGDDELILSRDALEGVGSDRGSSVSVTKVAGSNLVVFEPSGFAADSSGNTVLRVCGASGNDSVRALLVDVSGKARGLTDTDDSGVVNDPVSGGDIASCP